jgi:hypothetical protein
MDTDMSDMNWKAAFESDITGEVYVTYGPNWADGIPEEAIDALQAAYDYTAHVIMDRHDAQEFGTFLFDDDCIFW